MLKRCLLFLFALAVCFSPRIPVGVLPGTSRAIDLRAEDLVLAGLLILETSYLLVSGKTRIKKSPLFLPLLLWILLGFFSIFLNWTFGTLKISVGFFYFLKEIEFLLIYFLSFRIIEREKTVLSFLKVFSLGALANGLWVIYQNITGLKITYYYGPTAFIEPTGPFPSGGFFLLLFIFLFSMVLFYKPWDITKRIVYGGVSVVSLVGVLGSGSRASILGLVLSLVVLASLVFIKNREKIKLLKVVSLIFVLLGILFVFQKISKRNLLIKPPNLENIRWELTATNKDSRAFIFFSNLDLLREDPWRFLFGFGILGERHSQYIRVLMERGIFGLVIFGFLVFKIITLSWKGFREGNTLVISLSAGLLASTFAMLIMSLPNDAFMVVKVAEVYWFFVGLSLKQINDPFSIDNNSR